MTYPKQEAALERIYAEWRAFVRTVAIERLIDNCDGNPEELLREWNDLWDSIDG